jgi:hypothetical protein
MQLILKHNKDEKYIRENPTTALTNTHHQNIKFKKLNFFENRNLDILIITMQWTMCFSCRKPSFYRALVD